MTELSTPFELCIRFILPHHFILYHSSQTTPKHSFGRYKEGPTELRLSHLPNPCTTQNPHLVLSTHWQLM